MDLTQKIKAFVQLGELLSDFSSQEMQATLTEAEAHNRWFTQENLRHALTSIKNNFLSQEKLEAWAAMYPSLEQPRLRPHRVGLVMAGNIPMVGFHDFLSVLMSGHHLLAKLSTQDEVLMRKVGEWLIKIAPQFASQLTFVERLNSAQAYIATGSDNTARYFEYYFAGKPNIIRQNRNSIAILNGEETEEELKLLGEDIFRYFGLGCRSVSKIYLPLGCNPTHIYPPLEPWANLKTHNKYANNYDYHRAVLSLNQDAHYDNGFLLIYEHSGLSSPTANLFYEFYEDDIAIQMKLAPLKEKIQVIVSQNGDYPNSLPFGRAQAPELWDYADGVDTMRFLLAL